MYTCISPIYLIGSHQLCPRYIGLVPYSLEGITMLSMIVV